MIEVNLNEEEYEAVVVAAARTAVKRIFEGTRDKGLGAVDNTFFNTWIEGLAAEAASAKGLNYEHDYGVGIMNHPDGPYEIRQTGYATGHLFVQEKDNDDKLVILVTGEKSRYKLVGWMAIYRAKQDKWFDKNLRYPCYAVPQCELEPMETLPPFG